MNDSATDAIVISTENMCTFLFIQILCYVRFDEWLDVLLTRSKYLWCECGECETEALSSSSVFKNKIQSTKFDISCKFIYFLSHLLLVLEAVLIRDYRRFHWFIIIFKILFYNFFFLDFMKYNLFQIDILLTMINVFGVNLLRMCFWKPRSMLVWFSAVYTDEYLFKTESALWFNLYCCLLITWPYSRSFDSSGIVIGLYITAFNFCSFCLPTKVQKWLCK